jgi:hypothetical protein
MPGPTIVRPIGCSSALPRIRENAVEACSSGRPGRCLLRRFRDGESPVGDVGGLVGGGAWVVPLGPGDALAVVALGDEDGDGDGDGNGDGPLPAGLGLGNGDGPLPAGLGLGNGDGPLPAGLRNGDVHQWCGGQ